MIFVLTADDPKSGQYSEDEGWQFITLGDQVRYIILTGNIANNHRHILLSSFELNDPCAPQL